MNIDPEKIARMITEDPDEVVPSDHFDDFEDEYEDEDAGPICDTCGIRYNQNSPNHQYPGLIYSEVVRLSEILCASGYPCSRPYFNGRAFGDPVLPNMEKYTKNVVGISGSFAVQIVQGNNAIN